MNKKVLKELSAVGNYQHSYFYQSELLTSRFNYDEDEMENIYCVKSLFKRPLQGDDDTSHGISSMKAQCLKEISSEDLFTRICELTEQEYLDCKFLYTDGCCQELRVLENIIANNP